MNKRNNFISKTLLVIISMIIISCNGKQFAENHMIKIFLNGKEIQDEDKVDCSIELTDSNSKELINGGIEYRGSSSKVYPKRSYSVTFKVDKPIQWKGFKLKGDWVLYAPYADRTCVRNTLAQYLFGAMGHYTTKSIFVDLYINNDYAGLYELREKINLEKNGLDTIKGIFKFDKTTGKKKNKFPSLISPYVDILEHDLASKISFGEAFSTVLNFEKALLNGNKDLSSYADMNSFVDYFLFSEFANSPDAYRSSCFFQVLRDGRLSIGPVWDYDLAFGNSTLYNGFATKGWRFPMSEANGQSYTPAPKWWSSLYANPGFKLAIQKRWSHVRQTIFADSYIDSIVDSLANPIRPAVEKNFKKWSVIGKPILWTNAPQASYQAEIIYLKQWMSERARWIDLELSKSQ
jgi:hypothetical protein